MDIDVIRQLLELGWPALVTVGFVLLARQYVDQVSQEISYLRARIDKLEADLELTKRNITNRRIDGDPD